jgi:hypothetical protein
MSGHAPLHNAFVDLFVGSRCRKCGSTRDLIVHHKVPRAFGGTNDLSNLERLCRSCHPREEGVSVLAALVAGREPIAPSAPPAAFVGRKPVVPVRTPVPRARKPVVRVTQRTRPS